MDEWKELEKEPQSAVRKFNKKELGEASRNSEDSSCDKPERRINRKKELKRCSKDLFRAEKRSGGRRN
ncbi:hypothetical protein HPP92_006894 [Vanilla planifolia]|uniref:Uncharacterized protein n=1 Tax=Vanilla planifolia TaxID=51239 RepID=A0A835VBC8_VANPL|nr:hypothetical protein HPP92_006894 [Vanilla planifolia]